MDERPTGDQSQLPDTKSEETKDSLAGKKRTSREAAYARTDVCRFAFDNYFATTSKRLTRLQNDQQSLAKIRTINEVGEIFEQYIPLMD